jgi:hypothetical protein
MSANILKNLGIVDLDALKKSNLEDLSEAELGILQKGGSYAHSTYGDEVCYRVHPTPALYDESPETSEDEDDEEFGEELDKELIDKMKKMAENVVENLESEYRPSSPYSQDMPSSRYVPLSGYVPLSKEDYKIPQPKQSDTVASENSKPSSQSDNSKPATPQFSEKSENTKPLDAESSKPLNGSSPAWTKYQAPIDLKLDFDGNREKCREALNTAFKGRNIEETQEGFKVADRTNHVHFDLTNNNAQIRHYDSQNFDKVSQVVAQSGSRDQDLSQVPKEHQNDAADIAKDNGLNVSNIESDESESSSPEFSHR